METPADWGLNYEDVVVETEDGVRLHGWYVNQPGATKVLLFFHGNAGNISHRGDSVRIFHRLGLNVLIFDYRGYGKSDGKPSEDGLYQDAKAIWKYVTSEKSTQREDVILFGRSLGAAVAANLAAEVQPGAVILESSFSSASDMARSVFPILSYLTVMRFDFNTAESVTNITSPVLVVHSRDDEIIPFSLGRKVYEAAGQPKQFLEISGDHNNGFLRSQPRYEQMLAQFISDLPAQRSRPGE